MAKRPEKKMLQRIKVIAMDVDGVLTDGRIIFDGSGRELKFFDVKDGYAIHCCRKAGIPTAVISARSSRAVKARMKDLKIDAVYLDASPKLVAYEKLLQHFRVTDQEVCYIGDDLPDAQVLARVGVAAAPADAVPEVLAAADLVASRPGGRGAVREIIETVLKAQGKWNS